MKVSIITPSVRPEALIIVAMALKKQTFKDFEWLVGASFNFEIPGAKWIKDDFEGGQWSLNRTYNKLIREASGEIIISLQDSIYLPPDSVEKFVDKLEKCGKQSLITASGHQYARLNKYGKPELQVWVDPRRRSDLGSFYEVFPQDCEWNVCAFYKDALLDVGGFDEEMDFRCRGVDAFAVNQRLDALGYKFFIDHDNESFTLRHDRSSYGGEKAWNDSHGIFNGEHEKRVAELKKDDRWPRLDYL